MPVFDDSSPNCRKRTLKFFVIAAICLLLWIGFWTTVVGMFSPYGFIGSLVGAASGMGVLWFIIDMKGYSAFSDDTQYQINKDLLEKLKDQSNVK